MVKFLFVCIALIGISGLNQTKALAQAIIGDVQQLQQQVNQLRSDVDELQSAMAGLRRILVRQGTVSHHDPQERPTPLPRVVTVEKTPMDDAEIKSQICKAIGLFFGQIDRALKMSNSVDAEDLMKKTLSKLNSELDKYRTYPQVRHILTLAEGLAWDTYTAVDARYTTIGNADFIRAIDQYRQKYESACHSK